MAGCGFYGQPSTLDMCSTCFRALMQEQGVAVGTTQPTTRNKRSVPVATAKLPGESATAASSLSISVRAGDLTLEEVDVVVNAANASLDHASGLAGALSKAGGPVFQRSSDDHIATHGKVEVGTAVWGDAGTLPASSVLHAVGPMWRGGDQGEDILLAMAVRSVLDAASASSASSLALPAISSGVFGFPKSRCAEIIMQGINDWWNDAGSAQSLTDIRIVAFDTATVDVLQTALTHAFPHHLSPSLPSDTDPSLPPDTDPSPPSDTDPMEDITH